VNERYVALPCRFADKVNAVLSILLYAQLLMYISHKKVRENSRSETCILSYFIVLGCRRQLQGNDRRSYSL